MRVEHFFSNLLEHEKNVLIGSRNHKTNIERNEIKHLLHLMFFLKMNSGSLCGLDMSGQVGKAHNKFFSISLAVDEIPEKRSLKKRSKVIISLGT